MCRLQTLLHKHIAVQKSFGAGVCACPCVRACVRACLSVSSHGMVSHHMSRTFARCMLFFRLSEGEDRYIKVDKMAQFR